MAISVTPASPLDAAELAGIAAETFPLACPPGVDPADIAAHVAAQLSAQRFAEHLNEPDRIVLAARDDGRIIGYAMLIQGIGADPDIAASVQIRPAVELSKIYVESGYHRSGAAAALMQAGLHWAATHAAAAVWLGVNRNNQRAQRFYGKHGFAVTGARTFRLGNANKDDFVMVRVL